MEREQTHELRNKQTLIIRPAETSDAEAVVDYIRLVAGETDYLTVGASDIKATPERQAEIIEQHNATGGLFSSGSSTRNGLAQLRQRSQSAYRTCWGFWLDCTREILELWHWGQSCCNILSNGRKTPMRSARST